jgi:ABC-type Co2+ transport system permease subunit
MPTTPLIQNALVPSPPHSSQHWFKSGLETLFLGGACATVAYTIGQLVDQLLSDHGDGGHSDL